MSFHQELLTGSPGRARDKRTGLGGEQQASGRWESRDQPAEPLPQALGFIGPFPFVDGNRQLKLLGSSWGEGRKRRGSAQVTFPVLISSPLIAHPTPRGDTSLGVLFSSVCNRMLKPVRTGIDSSFSVFFEHPLPHPHHHHQRRKGQRSLGHPDGSCSPKDGPVPTSFHCLP